jgi:hypothetical protein
MKVVCLACHIVEDKSAQLRLYSKRDCVITQLVVENARGVLLHCHNYEPPFKMSKNKGYFLHLAGDYDVYGVPLEEQDILCVFLKGYFTDVILDWQKEGF